MLAALERFDDEGGDPTGTVDIPGIYDHIAFSEYSVSCIVTAIFGHLGDSFLSFFLSSLVILRKLQSTLVSCCSMIPHTRGRSVILCILTGSLEKSQRIS